MYKRQEVFPDTFQYINDGSEENITKITPKKYFLDRGVNLKEEVAKMPLVDPLNKPVLGKLISQIYKRYQTTETSVMLDKIKDLGFHYSTLSGISISIDDVMESQEKPEIIKNSQEIVDNVNKQFKRGLITENERYNKVVDVWNTAKENVKKELQQQLKDHPENSIAMMISSKARGDIDSYTQLVGTVSYTHLRAHET